MKVLVPAAFFLLFAASAAFGHGDEDHSEPAPVPSQAINQAVSPRATTASENFEVVAVLEGGKLALYLDRFASNEPVAGAKVEIEGGGLQGLAAESSPGVYAMSAASITPSKHPLTITVEAGDDIDLLSATLDVGLDVGLDADLPQAGTVPQAGVAWPQLAALLASGLFLLASVWWRARRKGKEVK